MKKPDSPQPKAATQIPLLADVSSDGAGGFTVRPCKPKLEITTVQAARILGVSRAQMWYLRNCHPIAMKILKWRFTSDRRGKLLWDSASVMAYMEHTKQLEA